MHHISPRAIACFLVLACLALSAACATLPGRNASVELGKRLYRQGILASGAPSQAIVQGDVAVDGTMFTCVSCHQRSGLGAMEGGDLTPAVTGPVLFAPMEIQRKELINPVVRRPAYTDETFARVMRGGIDPAGRQIDPLMPLYPLPPEDMENLIAYLKSISDEPDPGVSGTAVHLAMIIAGDVPEDMRQAALQLSEKYVGEKNSPTRQEIRRSASAPWHKDWQYESYRKYEFHRWELTGPPGSWTRQLEKAYARQPVFAVVGGLGDGETWQPVHDFCAARQLPCVLPSGLLAPPEDQDFYSLYFNGGLAMEARALAKFLLAQDQLDAACSVRQIHDPGLASMRAAAAFEKAVSASSGRFSVSSTQLGPERTLASLISDEAGAGACALILWLDQHRLEGLGGLVESQPEGAYAYLSASLVPLSQTQVQGEALSRLRFVYPFNPRFEGTGDPRLAVWAGTRHIDMRYPMLQTNVFFALNLGLDALVSLRGNFSRDYFLEKIEHMVDRMLFTPAYDHKSLAPGQRFISKGAYIVSPPAAAGEKPVPVSDWIVP